MNNSDKKITDAIRSASNGKISEINDGKGKWIVTDNLKSRALKTRLKEFLGKKGEMTYRFGDKTLNLKISSTFTPSLIW